MAGTVDEKWSIDKLDSSNWTTWKFQMRHLLLAKGLWGLVDGTEELAENANGQVRADFLRRSQKALSSIVMAVSTPQLYLITSCEQPNDAWDTLRNHFERDTLSNKLFLKKQYFRMEMKHGTSIEKHLKHMKEITDRLAAIGAPISEEDQVVTLLGSLPRSYSTLVTALEARIEDASLSFVQQALIHEERKLNGHPNREDRSLSALVGVQNKAKSRKMKCFNCGKPGHFRRDCTKKVEQDHHSKTAHKAKTVKKKHLNSDSESDVDPDSSGAFAASVGTMKNSQMDKWLVDSGASSHMTREKEILSDYRQFEKPEKVGLGDGRTVDAVGVGNVHVEMVFGISKPKKYVICQVLYVPKLTCNLFSVRAAAVKGKYIKFGHTKCWIRDSSGNLCGMGSLVDNLYHLDCKPVSMELASIVSKEHNDLDLWHQRLGHINGSKLKEIARKGILKDLKIPLTAELSFCEGCVEGKMFRKPFKSLGEIRSTRRLELVHSDVCGPMQTESIGGKRYFVTFIDDYSRCCSIYFLKYKSEVLEKFKEFAAITTNQSGQRIRTLRTDNGGEYVSEEFTTYLKLKGIHHQLTSPHSPQQNGVAERMNRTLIESARSMIAHAKLPNKYWAEAVATAAYIRNRTPTTAIKENVTPYEKWYERKPNVDNFKVFGCIAYAHIPESQRRKLDKKSKKLRFVGYSLQSKGYRLLDESTSRVFIRRDVTFNEADFCHTTETEPVEPNDTLIVDPDLLKTDESESEHQPEEQVGEESETEHSQPKRPRRPPIKYGFDEYADLAGIENQVHHVAYNASQVKEPKSMKEAMEGEQARQWKQATDSEYKSLIENDTWDLVKLPNGRTSIGCRWVFKVKHQSNGRVERFKGRLVAKGYAQKYGIDYDETFSPVVRFSSIRTLLAFAVQNGMLIHQMDVETAFLNGNLDEEIYMDQPEGYGIPGKEHLVCRLKKSLYGLKQSSRCWSTVFKKYMESNKFKQSTADPCVYIRNAETMIIVAVYVDDLIVIAETEEEMKKVKQSLSAQFKMKDMGKLHYCLGITIEQDSEQKCLWMHQKQYILKMLEKFGLSEAKPVSTPADLSTKLEKDDGVSKEVDSISYQSMVGSLLYAAMATRPDIAQAVRVVSKFNSKPNQAHLTAVKRIFRYLKGTVSLGVRYQKSGDRVLVGYSDADWAGDQDDRHSTTGNLFMMARGPITWLSKKQGIVALSTTEAEYVALSTATQEAVWLRRLLMDLNAFPNGPTVLMEDNQGAIAIAKNPIAHARTKHIDIRYHYIREAVQERTIELKYCPTNEMLADILTKPLSKGRFELLRQAMGMEKLPDSVQHVN